MNRETYEVLDEESRTSRQIRTEGNITNSKQYGPSSHTLWHSPTSAFLEWTSKRKSTIKNVVVTQQAPTSRRPRFAYIRDDLSKAVLCWPVRVQVFIHVGILIPCEGIGSCQIRVWPEEGRDRHLGGPQNFFFHIIDGKPPGPDLAYNNSPWWVQYGFL